LRKWKALKKDPKLKAAPSYNELAKLKRIDTSKLKKFAQRCLLAKCATFMSLFKPEAILCLDKAPQSCGVRADGHTPPVDQGPFFVPSASAYLETTHMMTLAGFWPEHDHNAWVASATIAKTDLPAFLCANVPVPLMLTLYKICIATMK